MHLPSAEIEAIVKDLWPHKTPDQIAEHIRYVDPSLKCMNAKWVCSIKQRIDNSK